jgi:hypothetical protein
VGDRILSPRNGACFGRRVPIQVLGSQPQQPKGNSRPSISSNLHGATIALTEQRKHQIQANKQEHQKELDRLVDTVGGLSL